MSPQSKQEHALNLTLLAKLCACSDLIATKETTNISFAGSPVSQIVTFQL